MPARLLTPRDRVRPVLFGETDVVDSVPSDCETVSKEVEAVSLKEVVDVVSCDIMVVSRVELPSAIVSSVASPVLVSPCVNEEVE